MLSQGLRGLVGLCLALAFMAVAPAQASQGPQPRVVDHRDEEPEFFDYAVGRRPEIELYDIKSDPHCMNNLAGEESAAKVQTELHDRLMDDWARFANGAEQSDDVKLL